MRTDPEGAAPVPGCPMQRAGARHAPFAHEGMYEFYRSIRAEVPIFHSPEIDYWVVTRREDVIPVLRDSERFSATIATQPVCPWPAAATDHLKQRNFTDESVQVACDPPRHSRIRQIAAWFLNVRQFSFYEDALRGLVRGYLDRIEGRDEADLVDALFYEFPAQAVFLLLGERNFDPRTIKKWGDLRLNMIWGKPGETELVEGARDLADFWDYTVKLVAARQAEPGDDYPSFLLKMRADEDETLTLNEIRSLVFGLLLAGHETTTNAAGNLFLELLRHRDQWDRLVADPALIPNAVEEGLRFASSVVAWRRTAKEEVCVAGKTLPAGTRFLLALASANHDEDAFDAPEVFDVGRANARAHVAFGNGLHHCLGAPLARLELRILLEELTARFPAMTLVPDQALSWTPTLSFRGPGALRVRLNGARPAG